MSAVLLGQEEHGSRFTERFEDWPTELTVHGTLVVADTAKGFREAFALRTGMEVRRRSSSNRGRDGASTNEDATWWILGDGRLAEEVRSDLQKFSAGATTTIQLGSLTVDSFLNALAHPRKPEAATDHPYGEAIAANSKSDRWILCDERSPDEWTENQWHSVQSALRSRLQDGAMVCCVGPMAKAMGKHYLPEGNDDPELPRGWNLIPDALVIWKGLDRMGLDQVRGRIAPALRVVTVEMESNQALVLQGRKMRVFGDGAATIAVAAGEHHPSREQRLSPRHRVADGSIHAWLIDWTQWRRDAIERTLDRFPPVDRELPCVERGSLVIVGGGGMPSGLMRRFVEEAGGSAARIVYVPCLEGEDAAEESGYLRTWKSMGVAECVLLHTKDRRRANEDPAFLEPLRTATGIWFGGGRQWNLADSYYGTTAHRLMKQVLDRGGVIGGSSAGASIQANYLARATPIENLQIMAPGYERGGLGFLRGVAIDQHFSQRNRQKDLRSLVATHPQLLGIGIDEATAIWVKQSHAEVVGNGSVYFYASEPGTQGITETSVGAGGWYDLQARRVMLEPEMVP